MPGPQGERCDECYFFEKKVYGGVCRLNPRRETVLTNGGLEPGLLPIQHDFDWCGSWKPKPTDDAAANPERR